MKVSIIGAGNVGATAALTICKNEFVDEIVLLDTREGVAEDQAEDIMQMNDDSSCEAKVYGVTNDYTATEGSDIIVITGGVPYESALEGCASYASESIYVIVPDPMDTMTLLAHKILHDKYGIPHSRIIGIGSRLDTARFNLYLENTVVGAGFDPKNLTTTDDASIRVLGGHGDTTMVPITSNIVYKKSEDEFEPIQDLLGAYVLNNVVANTMKDCATTTGLLGMLAADVIAETIQDIISGSEQTYPYSVYDPDFDLCIGTDAILGANGVEFTTKYELSEDEYEALKASIEAVRKVNTSITL